MSLMKTLAKVAIGMAVAKGVSSMTGKGRAQSGGGGLLDALTGGGGQSQGGLEGMLGGLLGGGQQTSGRSTAGGSGGGLGGLLDGLSDASTPRGGVQTGNNGGGLDSILDGLTGKGGAAGGLGDLLGGLTNGGGNLGGLLGGLLGAGAAATSAKPTGTNISFGEKFNQSLTHGGEPEIAPTPQQEVAAGLMLRAMIQAAKSDGKIDDAERAKLLGKLGDISPQERDFVNAELAAEIDVKGLARQVPNGMQAQVYTMSIMGIDLDNQAEAQYLHDFATELGIDKSNVDNIHAQLGVPTLYS